MIIIEDADRLTETRGHALLKAIEEPPPRTVWLLCAPSAEDVLVTIRSRCRHVGLRTPPTEAVADLLVRRDGIDPAMAAFAARAAQSHIGLARRLARDEGARIRRRDVVALPLRIRGVGDAVLHAGELVETAGRGGQAATTERDSAERERLLHALGADPSARTQPPHVRSPAQGAGERPEAPRHPVRRDVVDRALVDLLSLYRDVLVLQPATRSTWSTRRCAWTSSRLARELSPEDVVQCDGRHRATARDRIGANVAPLLALEAMACSCGRSRVRSDRAARAAAFTLLGGPRRRRRRAARSSACSRGRRRPGSRPTSGPSTPTVVPRRSPARARPFYDQKLSWKGCGDGFQCAKLTVPVDYADPAGNTIQLAVIKLPAGKPKQRIGSLVVNPGGPGGVRRRLRPRAKTSISNAIRRALRRRRLRPPRRGRERPGRLPDRRADRRVPRADPTPDDTRPRSPMRSRRGRCSARAASRPRPGARHRRHRDAAQDMDVLRAALGDARLFYLGKSYGTYLGATYADLFPTNIGRMVLDGVIDPRPVGQQLDLGQAEGFEQATRAFVADCVAPAGCPVGSDVDAAMKRVRGLLTAWTHPSRPATRSVRSPRAGPATASRSACTTRASGRRCGTRWTRRSPATVAV